MDNSEKVICAAVRIGRGNSEPIIIGGLRHGDCIKTAINTNSCKLVRMNMMGFITSKNRFVDRREAYLIAVNAGQVKAKAGKDSLYSEDLY